MRENPQRSIFKFKTFDKFNYSSSLSILHHNKYVTDLAAAKRDNDNDEFKPGIIMRHQSIQPKLSFRLSSLKQEFIDIYNRTWCTNNFNATIVNGKYKWISLNARLSGSPALVPPRLQFPP